MELVELSKILTKLAFRGRYVLHVVFSFSNNLEYLSIRFLLGPVSSCSLTVESCYLLLQLMTISLFETQTSQLGACNFLNNF